MPTNGDSPTLLCKINAKAWNKDTLQVSPDARHIAWVEKRNAGMCVIRDGHDGAVYEDIDPTLTFSPDSTGLAYIARKNRKSFVVVNSQEMAPHDMVVTVPIFTANSNRIIYSTGPQIFDGQKLTSAGGIVLAALPSPDSTRLAAIITRDIVKGKFKHAVIVDGEHSPLYDEVRSSSLYFSQDSKRVLYAALLGKDWFVVVDGKPGSKFKRIRSCLFSDDSEHYAYVGIKGITVGKIILAPRWFLVVDGQESKKPYADLQELCFLPPAAPAYRAASTQMSGGVKTEGVSSEGTRLAYIAKPRGRATKMAVINEREGKLYDDVRDLAVNSDGSRVVYVASAAGKCFTVVSSTSNSGGEEGKPYSQMGAPIFSPDGNHIAVVARTDEKTYVLVDSVERGSYWLIAHSKLAFDSSGSLHFLMIKKDTTDIYPIEMSV